jgi:hypothetical protein
MTVVVVNGVKMEDPKVRADGRCALTGCGRLRHPERSRRYAGFEADKDPFCSSVCARAFYGVTFRLDGDPREEHARFEFDADQPFIEVNA